MASEAGEQIQYVPTPTCIRWLQGQGVIRAPIELLNAQKWTVVDRELCQAFVEGAKGMGSLWGKERRVRTGEGVHSDQETRTSVEVENLGEQTENIEQTGNAEWVESDGSMVQEDQGRLGKHNPMLDWVPLGPSAVVPWPRLVPLPGDCCEDPLDRERDGCGERRAEGEGEGGRGRGTRERRRAREAWAAGLAPLSRLCPGRPGGAGAAAAARRAVGAPCPVPALSVRPSVRPSAGVWAQLRLLEAGGGQRAPGDSVLLSCRGHGSDFGTSTVRWYRQAPGGSLEWVSLIHFDSSLIRYGAAVDGRATVSRDNSRSEASLSLRALSPGDSARYFCAVLTHSISVSSVRTEKLVFGSGTTLTVEPGNISHSDPQVIVMRSKNLEEDGNSGKAACLARKFYTKNIILEVSSTEVRYEQSTPLLTSEGLYDALKVVNVTKGTEVSCTARYDGRDITANETLPEKEAEGSVGEAEGSVGEKVCNSTDTSAQDAEGEKSNTLAVAVLGLRVLLAKSLAFNTLMSIELFVF
ncbi:uncharacterized protein LOC133629423 [Colius striatus]|uniref:uncharacterized protein LOC133629423 n=1 Tax=Colius striatus TaxID=57412 RepID=UPI002B1D0DD5|nr:uncharacterized protein LOC133629423 [Colius striatus]